MKIRHAITADIPRIIKIIADAKVMLRSLNIDQWQNGYPNKTQIKNDIDNKESYVVLNDEYQIVATTMFSINGEPTYKVIEGNWMIDETEKYGVIHRLATAKEFRKHGIAAYVFNHFHDFLKQEKIQSLKIDTHQDNHGMQFLVKKFGYQYCGTIQTSYGDKRLAFEKIIE